MSNSDLLGSQFLPKIPICADHSRLMVHQLTLGSQQYKLLHDISKKIPSNNSPMILPALDLTLSTSNYESLQAMVKTWYLLSVAQRSSLEFIFKALVGMVESQNFDFLQSQSVSTMQQHNIDLLTAELAAKGSGLSQLSALFLLSQQQLQTSQTKDSFYREQLFGACPSVLLQELDLLGKSDTAPEF
jgi:hypothetical protein